MLLGYTPGYPGLCRAPGVYKYVSPHKSAKIFVTRIVQRAGVASIVKCVEHIYVKYSYFKRNEECKTRIYEYVMLATPTYRANDTTGTTAVCEVETDKAVI